MLSGSVAECSRIAAIAVIVAVNAGLEVQASKSVTVAWDPNPETNITHYHVLYGTESRNYSLTETVDTVTTATITNLQEGLTYYFAVTAENVYGLESDPSVELSYNVPVTSVNVPPLAAADSVNAAEDTVVTISFSKLLGNDSDPNTADTLTVVAAGPSSTAGGAASNSGTSVVFTPKPNFFGNDTFPYVITDAGGLTATGQVTMVISAVNDPPTISSIASQSINQDTSTGPIGFTVNDVDDPATSLTLTGQSSNLQLVPQTGITIGGTGTSRTVTITPAPGLTGSALVSIIVSDGKSSSSTSMTLTVQPVATKPVITWNQPGPFNYGHALGAGELNATANVPGTFSYTPQSGTMLNAGNHQMLSVSFAPDDQTRYLTASSAVYVDVRPAPLKIDGPVAAKMYGASMPALTPTYSGFVNGDTASSLDSPPTISTAAGASSPTGTYPVSVSGASDANYAITQVAGSLTITPAALTIRADDLSRSVDETNPPLTATYLGLANGDTPASLDVPAALSTTATPTCPAGTYPIVAQGAADANYTITEIDGVLTVVSGFSANINFQPDGAPPAGYVEDAGFVFGDRGGGQSFGWDTDNTSSTRVRNSRRAPDERYSTLTLLQKPGMNMTWEIAVPNGWYEVFLVAGDPNEIRGAYEILAEGLPIVVGSTDRDNRWLSGLATVEVTDGRLTVSNGPSGQDNKVCFLDMRMVPSPAATLAVAEVAPPPRIKLLSLDTPGHRWLDIEGTPGLLYGLQTSTNLAAWKTTSIMQLNESSTQFLDPDSNEVPIRYYRVINDPNLLSVGQ